ncbi:hypothetical protein PHLGIDRAFT_122715 [Phlebiopsis gigantea 11061_1 CR5-6]|uniref:Uncharacterized protein n=1 Tax=Phlebiopsis gigantea (strain 11061_1 CR5-6) TaxID=745531 RepID=A0A0C3S304_PHLG1|nr:hypothetical protein PHLGIDRAFT_122715 [Phlebiopsis gigantea 11061_1 CR5-6]
MPAIESLFSKLDKYYLKLNNTLVYILLMFLDLYYKFQYFEMKWGGKKEQ